LKKSLLPHLFASSQADQKIDRKILLQPLSVRINGGSLFAILGGSGSGKTSLLNVIAQRYDRSNTIVGGDGVTFITSQWKRKMCKVGYVTQADYLLPYLTVTETITFAAKLKMQQKNYDGNTTDLITELVNNLILELGLSECALTMIGDDAASSILSAKRGISGGEKRRVSVALQIISNPESNKKLFHLKFDVFHLCVF
jgi:ABC-type multidrug transport system ATPase subunit